MVPDAEVIVVGAGLAGLCCARRLKQGGIEALVLEASDAVGGRVRTDQVDGFRLDRGFQILLSAYPEARRVLDYEALDLRTFYAGALVRSAGGFHRLADPWRHPWDALRTALSPIGTPLDKLRTARLRYQVTRSDLASLLAVPNTPSLEFLRAFGFSEKMIDRFFRPFFGGIFLEPNLTTSSRMLQFVFRMFAEGEAVLPAEGMGAIPRQLAAGLAEERLRLQAEVVAIDGSVVTLASKERLQARTIVVATTGATAARLIDGLQPPSARSTTCLYFAATKSPTDEPILVLNADGGGPINNMCVPSLVAEAYAPSGAVLISTTVLGEPGEPNSELERAVRSQLTAWFGTDVRHWQCLRIYRIPHALPEVVPRWLPASDQRVAACPSLYVCGDHTTNASIQGAMVAGRYAAETILAELGMEADTAGRQRH